MPITSIVFRKEGGSEWSQAQKVTLEKARELANQSDYLIWWRPKHVPESEQYALALESRQLFT